MKKRYMRIAVVMASILCILSGCGQVNKTTEGRMIEGLEELGTIQVISREDGSGTRSTFAELVDFQAEGEVDGKQSDLTTSNAVIANDAGEVIHDVENNKSAIGYVSKGALTGEENVKTLTVEGQTSEESKKYPLSRDFYLAYIGTLNELELDFLTYVHGAGQEIVAKNYGTVAKSSAFLSNQAEGEILIEGSTSVAPLMEQLAEAYEKINTHATITVIATDSTQGLTQAMAGKCDFAMSSRNLKDYEKELLDYESIARDNIVVIVGKDNPMTDILLSELKEIYTGGITAWEELNQQ